MKDNKDYQNNYDEVINDKEIDKIVKDYYNDYKDIDDNSEEKIQSNLNKSQKMAIGVLSFFAVVVIIIWFVQLKRSLSEPLQHNVNSINNLTDKTDSYCSGPNCVQNQEEDLRNKDTDKDGLSDWDELNIYYTSPYLEDTDSDGFSDKEEIDSGNDPNCPAGRDCYNQEEQSQIKSEKAENVIPLSDVLSNNSYFEQNLNEDDLKNILEGKTDANTLREALINSGVPKNVLDNISDQELIEVYKNMLNNNK